jgi:polar amino acid transport system substrate-binding protein
VNELSPSVLYRLLLILLSILPAACASLPRDPENTLQRVQSSGRVRVGLVENPPWVVRTAGEPAGAEVELVRRFASELGATPEWYWGGEEQHLEALERFELDLVVVGLTDKTPWAQTVGLTRPYFNLGYWWADSVAAGLISFEIVKDGASSLRNSIAQLMNKRPTDVESKEDDPVPHKVEQELGKLEWVAGAPSAPARRRRRAHGRSLRRAA